MIAERLKSLREKQRLSIQDVADIADISKTLIWELEKNKSLNPSLNTLKKLSELFGVTVGFLIGETSELPKLHSKTLHIAMEIEKTFYEKAEK